MRNVSNKLLIAGGALVVEMAAYFAPFVIGSVPAPAQAEGSQNKPQIVTLNQASPQAVQIQIDKPDYDREVLAPLKAAQAAKAKAEAEARAKARKRTVRTVKTKSVVPVKAVTVVTGDVWQRLRMCEAGGSYTRNSGNGYYGAYQYNLGSWGNYGGYSRPDLAPPAVQDQKARETQASRGWRPWPACSRKLGLA